MTPSVTVHPYMNKAPGHSPSALAIPADPTSQYLLGSDAQYSCLPCRRVVDALADTLPYCEIEPRLGTFSLPLASKVAAARVVVASCSAAGVLREVRQRAAESSGPCSIKGV